MIHLFDNIFLKADKLFKGSRKRIVISEVYGVFKDVPVLSLHEVNDTVPSLPLLQAVSYTDLINNTFGGNENKFFQYVLEQDRTDRITVYCDPAAMVTLLTKFWKTLYPDWTREQYIQVLIWHLSYFQEILGTGHTTFTKIRQDEASDIYTTYTEVLSDDNLTTLADNWNTVTPWRINAAQRERIIKGASIELQTASLLLNPSWKYADTVKTSITNMIRYEVIREFIYEVRFAILHALVNFKYIEPTTSFDILEHTVDDLVTMHPEYAFLNDPRFLPDNHEYVFANYDMNTLKAIHDKVKLTRASFEVDWSPLIKQDLDYTDVIEYEQNRQNTSLFTRCGKYTEMTNPYLVDALFTALRNDSLSQYAYLELK